MNGIKITRKANLTPESRDHRVLWHHTPADWSGPRLVEIDLELGVYSPCSFHEDEDEVFYVEKGPVVLVVGSQDIELDRGDSAQISSGILHGFKLPPGVERGHVYTVYSRVTD